MLLFKAFYRGVTAFCESLTGSECLHEHLNLKKKPAHCPDCGYQIRLLWTIVRCRTCGTKRLPKRGLDGKISPLYHYCQDCGAVEYRIIKKEKIHVHEMAYALCGKEVDYNSEERVAFSAVSPGPGLNPFRNTAHVVNGEVLGSRYVPS